MANSDNLIDISSYRKTSRGNVVLGSVTFISYKTGISRFALITEDRRCKVARNYNRATYYALVDGVSIGRLYRSEQSAMTAAFDKAYGK